MDQTTLTNNQKVIYPMRAYAHALLALLCLGGTLHASDQPLLDLLVANGTITQEQADDVRRQLAQAAAQAEEAPPSHPAGVATARPTAPAPAPERVLVSPARNTISELKIRGRIQGQVAYSDGSNSGTSGDAGNYNTFELRRVRLGVQGKIFDDWRFLVEANVLTDTDLDSATLTWTGHPLANITFGKAKPQFGHEENTSSASILTLERSRLTGIFNGGKPLGLRVHGNAGMFGYYAGVFNGESVETGRMASDMDSALWNLSGELKLDELIGDGHQLRLRGDYLHRDADDGYYRFEHAFALSGHYVLGAFDLRAEYMWGEDEDNAQIHGFYVMPSLYLVPKTLQAVLRYENISGDDGVSLGRNRYADRVPGLYGSGNDYVAYYAGLNYYIYGDNLKLMAGIERAESKDGSTVSAAKGRSTTLISGVRMQF